MLMLTYRLNIVKPIYATSECIPLYWSYWW